MKAFVAGAVIGAGVSWIVLYLLATLFDRFGIYGHSGFLRPRSSTREGYANVDSDAKAGAGRMVVLSRRGLPVALIFLIAGIALAII